METIPEPLSEIDETSRLMLDEKLLYSSPVHHLDQPNGVRRRCRSECLQMSPVIHHSNGFDLSAPFSCKATLTNGDYRDTNFPVNGKRIFADCFNHTEYSKENIAMGDNEASVNDFVDHHRFEKLSKKTNILYNAKEDSADKEYFEILTMANNDVESKLKAKRDSNIKFSANGDHVQRIRACKMEQSEPSQVPKQQARVKENSEYPDVSKKCFKQKEKYK